MFPDNVRALVVDGVLDPIAWSTGAPGEGSTVPFSTRLRSDTGAQATLEEFFRLCDAGGPRCAFAGGAAGRFAALAARLQVEPIPIVNPATGAIILFDYSALIANALGAMYDSLSWPGFAGLLAFLEARADAAALGVALGVLWEQAGLITKRGFPNYPHAVEGFPGVACSDSFGPASRDAGPTRRMCPKPNSDTSAASGPGLGTHVVASLAVCRPGGRRVSPDDRSPTLRNSVRTRCCPIQAGVLCRGGTSRPARRAAVLPVESRA